MTSESDPLESARRAALVLLGRRDFASFELRNKLLAKGHSAAVVDDTLAALRTERLLDDGRFLDNFVRAHAGRGQGPARIRQELRQLGFTAEPITSALETGPDFLTLCREVRVRKFGARPPSNWAEKGKQARFLQYRGFSSDHIRLAMGQDPDSSENPADDYD
ncbi:MAG: regulatory protein RecX [Gammaproteobacteria bacterium]